MRTCLLRRRRAALRRPAKAHEGACATHSCGSAASCGRPPAGDFLAAAHAGTWQVLRRVEPSRGLGGPQQPLVRLPLCRGLQRRLPWAVPRRQGKPSLALMMAEKSKNAWPPPRGGAAANANNTAPTGSATRRRDPCWCATPSSWTPAPCPAGWGHTHSSCAVQTPRRCAVRPCGHAISLHALDMALRGTCDAAWVIRH